MRAITPSKRDGGTWKRKRAYCKICRRRVAVYKNGSLYPHTTGYIGEACDGAGLRGVNYDEMRAITESVAEDDSHAT